MTYEKFYYSLKVSLANELEERKSFIKNLEHNLKKIISSTTEINNNLKNNNHIKQNKIKYISEKLTLSSPFTLFEGSESNGKTTFIESICESVSKNEISLSYINKIKVINLLNYFTCFQTEDSLNLFINDILDVIENKDIKNNLQKFLFPDFSKNNLNKLSINFDLILETNKKINKPILFVIDNIEKIDSNFDIVLETINKLSFINNFAFLFIVNENFSEATDNYSSKNNESTNRNYKKLVNFVNLPIYKFSQDYTCLLRKYDLDHKLIDDLNNLLINNKEYKISLKDLNNLLTILNENNNHVDKYKLLASLYRRFPNIQSSISDIIYNNINLFSDGLNKLIELKDYKLLISKEFIDNHYYLSELTNIENNSYWYSSEIRYKLEDDFQKISSNCYNAKKWTKYKSSLLAISKKINARILNIENEIKSIEERNSANRILKTRKNKANIDNAFSIENNNINTENFEISHIETLNDHLVLGDPEEIKKTNSRLKEINVILSNLKVIRKDLETYFYNLENNTKEMPKRIYHFLQNKAFKDDIRAFNSALLDNEVRKYIKESNSYKELLKLKSLEDIPNNEDLNVLDDVISLVDGSLFNYIVDNYKELD